MASELDAPEVAASCEHACIQRHVEEEMKIGQNLSILLAALHFSTLRMKEKYRGEKRFDVLILKKKTNT